VSITSKQTDKIKKLGLLHSKCISSLNVDVWEGRFLGETHKYLQSKPLKKFTYSSYKSSNKELILISDLFRKFGAKRLEKLSFLFQETPMVQDRDAKVIAKNVRHLTKLKSLDFGIYNFYNITGTFLAPLKRSLMLLPSLKHFKITTELCDSFDESGLNYIIHSMDGLNPNNIQSLYFDISKIREDLSDFLPKLMQKLESFPQLRKLGLNLIEDPIKLAAFQESMSVIPKLKNLEEINFSAIEFASRGGGFFGAPRRKLDEDGKGKYHQALMQYIGANPNIKNIQIRLSDLQKTGFEILNKSLGDLNALQSLKLNLEIPSRYDDDDTKLNPEYLDDECWTNLGLSLKKHSKTLKIFSFRFNVSFGGNICANVTTGGCGNLANALAKCTNLENLDLMHFNPLEPRDIAATFKAVQNMKQMKFLDLELKASQPVDSDVIVAFKDTLTVITGVEKLGLNFKGFQEVSDQDIKGISQGISCLDNMIDFCLELENVPKITEAGLNFAVETLKGLKALRTGRLDFVLHKPEDIFGKSVSFKMPDIKYQNKKITIGKRKISL